MYLLGTDTGTSDAGLEMFTGLLGLHTDSLLVNHSLFDNDTKR